ncbi:acetyltransferase [Christiangramia sp. ASW11-125]|uniref:acetyltransferase n=1 Tax=Christiangramia sp. ASW11-125 TaxID=3400701 RepID=UPI003AAE3526
MLILGAKGHAKEILLVLINLGYGKDSMMFYDDVSPDLPEKIYSEYSLIRNRTEALEYLTSVNPAFCLGTGNPYVRLKLANFFKSKGKLTSIISKSSILGTYEVFLGDGLNIMEHCFISNEVSIGEGTLINAGAQIHHEVKIGRFCEVGPGAKVLGRSLIGNLVSIGANATILPDVNINDEAVIGAGAVVTRNVASGTTVVGVPAKNI